MWLAQSQQTRRHPITHSQVGTRIRHSAPSPSPLLRPGSSLEEISLLVKRRHRSASPQIPQLPAASQIRHQQPPQQACCCSQVTFHAHWRAEWQGREGLGGHSNWVRAARSLQVPGHLPFPFLGFPSGCCWIWSTCKQGLWLRIRGASLLWAAFKLWEFSGMLSWWSVSGFIEQFSHVRQVFFFSWSLPGSLAAVLHCHFNGTTNNETRSAKCSSSNLISHSSQVSDGCVRRYRQILCSIPSKSTVLRETAGISFHLPCQIWPPPSTNPW